MSSSNEPPMHLQFCPWLMQQISSGKYLGLEWLDEDRKRLFKIPWTKKYYPHWEEHHEIFRAWAIYRGKDNGGAQTLSQMKSNFRTILRKCVVIEEVQCAHQLGLQTGNYKVYRVLSEAEAQKKRLSQRKHKKKSCDVPPNIPSVASKKLQSLTELLRTPIGLTTCQTPKIPLRPPTIATLDSYDLSTQSTVPAVGATEDLVSDMIKVEEVEKSSSDDPWYEEQNQKPITYFPSDVKIEDTSSRHAVHSDPEKSSLNFGPPLVCSNGICAEEKEDLLALSTQNDGTEKMHGFQMLLQAAELAEGSNPPSDDSVEITDDDSADVFAQTLHPSIVDVLVELKIPPAELFTYELHVRYETRRVLEDATLDDMSYGYRIHYSNSNNQNNPHRRTRVNEQSADFERTPVVLPESKVPPGNSLYTVLKNMVAGMVVRSDKTYTLRCKRLCQARIFAFTAYGDVAAELEPMSLGRNQDTVLFSYKKFLTDWRQFLIDGSPRPNIEINLAFGKKPKQRHSRVFVAVTLIPKAAKTMMQRISSVGDRSNLDSSSDESSYDNILRLFYR